tara:strand:+ start:583 stop:852 length:270 start_codon:yes stop_codon:yes gene_type:complete
MQSSQFKKYSVAFYWSVQTLTTVGFGDQNANGNPYERILGVSWMIVGVVVQSYLIGNFIGILTSFDGENAIIEQKLDVLKFYCAKHSIS